jgi:hypothetical protein
LRGPQLITRRGVETTLMLSVADYHKMRMGTKTITELFRRSPVVGEDLDPFGVRSRIRAIPRL